MAGFGVGMSGQQLCTECLQERQGKAITRAGEASAGSEVWQEWGACATLPTFPAEPQAGGLTAAGAAGKPGLHTAPADPH